MLRIWAGNVEFDDTLLSPCVSGTRLDACSFYWSGVCSFLRVSRHLSVQPESVSGTGRAAVPPPWAQSHASLLLTPRQLFCIKETLCFQRVSKKRVIQIQSHSFLSQHRLHRLLGHHLPDVVCPVKQEDLSVHSCMLFEVLFFLFSFFSIQFGFSYSQNWNLGLKYWKNSTEIESLQKTRAVNLLSVLDFTLVSGKWQKNSTICPEQPFAHHQRKKKRYLS